MDNLDLYNKVKQPPKDALKQIGAGRLKGMTDINPQWRYHALTEHLGPCGIGWKYQIVKLWMDNGTEGQVIAWAEIALHIKVDGAWSEAIPGIGGSTFIAKEKSGLHTSDEAYKMAVTDALSVACKMVGIGADIYAGKWDGSKYNDKAESANDTAKSKPDNNSYSKKTPEGDILEKIRCTDGPQKGKDVAKVYCQKSCPSREGCPDWEVKNKSSEGYNSSKIPDDEIPF